MAKGEQKKHNPGTRGINKGKKSKWLNALYNPELDTIKKELPEPLDTIQLDWRNEFAHFVNDNNHKLYAEEKPDGTIDYRVRDIDGELVLTVNSRRNLFDAAQPDKKRRTRKKKN